MFKRILNFYRVSYPAADRLPADKADRQYKKLRLQAFVAATLGYSLYYVCRTSLNVMKQPIIDSGVLDATQLGIIGACLYWTYAVGKFVNGFLADYCNIKKFMATGLIVSAFANFMMGVLGFWGGSAGIASASMFIMFAIMWTLNGWSQSMGSPPAIISLSRWYPLKIRSSASAAAPRLTIRILPDSLYCTVRAAVKMLSCSKVSRAKNSSVNHSPLSASAMTGRN